MITRNFEAVAQGATFREQRSGTPKPANVGVVRDNAVYGGRGATSLVTPKDETVGPPYELRDDSHGIVVIGRKCRTGGQVTLLRLESKAWIGGEPLYYPDKGQALELGRHIVEWLNRGLVVLQDHRYAHVGSTGAPVDVGAYTELARWMESDQYKRDVAESARVQQEAAEKFAAEELLAAEDCTNSVPKDCIVKRHRSYWTLMTASARRDLLAEVEGVESGNELRPPSKILEQWPATTAGARQMAVLKESLLKATDCTWGVRQECTVYNHARHWKARARQATEEILADLHGSYSRDRSEAASSERDEENEEWIVASAKLLAGMTTNIDGTKVAASNTVPPYIPWPEVPGWMQWVWKQAKRLRR